MLERTLGEQDLPINTQDTNGSFRNHHSMKKSMNYSNTFSVSVIFISWHLKKFYEYELGFWELQTQMYPWISCTLDFWLQFCEKKCGLYMDVYGIDPSFISFLSFFFHSVPLSLTHLITGINLHNTCAANW